MGFAPAQKPQADGTDFASTLHPTRKRRGLYYNQAKAVEWGMDQARLRAVQFRFAAFLIAGLVRSSHRAHG